MAEVASAYVTLLPSARGFGKKVERELGGELETAGKTGSTRMSRSIGGVLKRSALGIGIAAGGILGTALFKGFGRLNAIEQARAKLSALGNTTKTVDTIMANALASVKGTAFGLDEAATTAASAVAAGIKPGKELTKYLTLAGDAAAITGTSLADMGGTLNNVQTIGAAYNDSLQIFAQKGLPVYSLLADKLGVSTAKVKEMASQGKISAETFNEVLSDKIGGAALKAGDTFEGASKNLQASLGRIGASLLSGIFPKAQGGLSNLTLALAPLEAKSKSVGTAIGGMVGFVQRNATAFKILAGVLAAIFIPAMIVAGVRATISGVQMAVAWVRAQVAAVRSAAVQVISAGRVVGGWVMMGAAAVRSGAQTAAVWAMYKAEAVKAAAIHVAQVGRMAAASVAQGARAAAAWVASSARTVAALAVQTAGFVASRAVMIAGAVVTGVMVAAQWALNVAMTANPIGLVVLALVLLVGGLILAYKKSETFRNIVNAAFTVMKTVVLGTLQAVWTAVRFVFGLVVGYVRAQVAAMMAVIRGVTAVAGIIGGAFRSAYTAVTSWIGKIVGAAKGIASKILGAIGNANTMLYEAGKKIIAGLIKGITDKLGPLADIAKKVAGTIGKVLPGSPVREGPLKVLNRGYAGGQIVDMLADGMQARSSSLRAVMDGMLAGTITGPALRGAPAFAGAAGASTSTGGGVGDIRIWIGEREITDIVRVEVGSAQTQTARQLTYGRRL